MGQFGGTTARPLRVTTGNPRPETVTCQVICEDVLTIDVEDVGSYALMWTPTEGFGGALGYTADDGILDDRGAGVPEQLALAAGFAFTEGILDGIDDISDMSVCPDRPDVVRIRLVAPDMANIQRRNVVIGSSCGVCGGREQILSRITERAPASDRLRLSVHTFALILEFLRRHQRLFHGTGGSHAALAFDQNGGISAFAEDIGRHNAIDKIIGQLLLKRLSRVGAGVFVSSRLSYEMVAKAARAGFELIAAISAPTSLAIEMAHLAGITLCAFVRGEVVEVYTHPHRILRPTSTKPTNPGMHVSIC